MYTVMIADKAELTESIIKAEFSAATPPGSEARSSSIGATLTIDGKVPYDAEKGYIKDAVKDIAMWSMVKPDSVDAYKKVTVTIDHTGETRIYELSHAFVVSFSEYFEDQNGYFRLVVRQKKDRLDGVTVS